MLTLWSELTGENEESKKVATRNSVPQSKTGQAGGGLQVFALDLKQNANIKNVSYYRYNLQ